MKSFFSKITLTLISLSAFANASEYTIENAPIKLLCDATTRAVVGHLNVGIYPLAGVLKFDFDKFHFSPNQTYQFKGSNQSTGGKSVLDNSSVSIQKNKLGNIQISAQAEMFDRATKIGEKNIQISLKKLGWGYDLSGFQVDGKAHTLPFATCKLFLQ